MQCFAAFISEVGLGLIANPSEKQALSGQALQIAPTIVAVSLISVRQRSGVEDRSKHVVAVALPRLPRSSSALTAFAAGEQALLLSIGVCR